MKLLSAFSAGIAAFLPMMAAAHEAYVVPEGSFWPALERAPSTRAFQALADPHNIQVAMSVVAGILLLLGANFLFRRTAAGRACHRSLERLSFLGPLFVRAAIAASLFFSAWTGSFLGPELPLSMLPLAEAVRVALFASGILIFLGLFTRFAAMLALAAFTVGFAVFGMYLFTYLNYLGEIAVLLLFGMRVWSADRFLFGPLKRLRRWEKYETTIVRVFYGIALIYAGITVKFLHPDLTIQVIQDWNLTQFHWLFPSDPLLVALGAGLAEVCIGLFIIIGFEMRLTVLVSLFYITLSLLYFRELVWPHLMLYGISLNLLVQPEVFTVDDLLFGRRRWWRKPLSPHTPLGKSAQE